MIESAIKLIETWPADRLNAEDAPERLLRLVPGLATNKAALDVLRIVRHRRMTTTGGRP